MRNKRFISLLMIISFLIIGLQPNLSGQAALNSQNSNPDQRIEDLLDEMTPEEKVGQLFLVTFLGSEINESSQIYDLVVNHYIGGAVLLRDNDNFIDSPDTVENAYNLIRDIQSLVWTNAQGQILDPFTNTRSSTSYIPLFIGISQEGDGYPNNQILSGLSPLPDQMALGATWQPELAMEVGKVAGQELSEVGFNLFFGPSLDVLTSAGISGGSDLGVRSFGGDPYWVGEMGSAYIAGMHEGSLGRIAVIAKHFPGKGSSDRSSFQEVATVRKSLEQLKQIELEPFFHVTKSLPGEPDSTDGLLVSHIRYQGFQGNIRTTTKPVSFDPQALSQIIALSPFSTWRDNGGVIVSDDLGSQAVRRFYDPANQSFFARIVARDAFLAGNDILYMGNIISTDAEDNYSTIIQTLDYFTQKYNEDAAFAQRVDESVRRILSLKFRLFKNFTLSNVLSFSDLTGIGISQAVTNEVARQSATLINPNALDLDVLVPSPPGYYDRVLFLTDTKQQQQCSSCIVEPAFGKDAFLDAVYKFYGPQAGGLVNRGFLASYSFDDLSKILLGGEGNIDLENELNSADWVVISILDSNSDQSLLDILRRFLFERQDILRNKKVILFAFNAPYYLDSTDISKLTAYYGLFSKSQPFIDVAARLLFQELTPSGDLPVSVSGIGYDLFEATSPDPNQIINLFLETPIEPVLTPSTTPQATATSSFKVGDTITVRTGVILDHNNRQVPDGTGVRFTLTSSTEGNILQIVDTVTEKGIASTSFGTNQPGLVELRAIVEPSVTSVVMQIDITSEGINVTVIPPTSTVNELAPVTDVTPSPTPSPLVLPQPKTGGVIEWFFMVILLVGIGWLAYIVGGNFYSNLWGFRWALCILLAGLICYDLILILIPGGYEWYSHLGITAKAGLVFGCAVFGWMIGFIWKIISTSQGGYQTDKK